jgi:hypothetical protein
MPGKVDWLKANCKGINTELFYMETDELAERKIQTTMIRRVCFTCPIQKACLQEGLNEKWGVWGGLSAQERFRIKLGFRGGRALISLHKDLENMGIELTDVIGGVTWKKS